MNTSEHQNRQGNGHSQRQIHPGAGVGWDTDQHPIWASNLQWQDGGRTFGMQSLRNGDRPTWGRRADGGGLAGGAAVALAEKTDYTQRQISDACRLPPACAVSLVQRAGRIAVLGRKALQTSSRVSM